MNLVWFKSDLRVYDNPALHAAVGDGPTLAVYCLTEEQWNRHEVAIAKRSLIKRQLEALACDLSALNIPLLVIDCDAFEHVPPYLDSFVQKYAVTKVFCNHDYEVNECSCLRAVNEVLVRRGISMRMFHDQCAIAPGLISTKTGDMFKVFTAFKRAYFRLFDERARSLIGKPDRQGAMAMTSDLSALHRPGEQYQDSGTWLAGEDQAHRRLNHFLSESVSQYHVQRDFPALGATSSLSPYLAAGILSTRQCLHAAISANEGLLESGRRGLDSWINELVWRDFYRHLLVAFPKLCRFQPFKQDTDRLPWKRDAQLFDAWRQGKTGYPLVDAAMRQLQQTGWMHNRLRMVVAMFLTKHLFIDWRMGERHFMQQLIDGDFASNNGGWQWSASTGVDAAPYFRIFNPTRQSERFDPDGRFIRQFVPELADLDNKSIHCPSPEQRMQRGYILPIVDHTTAVAQTKHWFSQLKTNHNEGDVSSETKGRFA